MVTINTEKCIGCGLCVKDCISEKITLENGKAQCGYPCIMCGHCVAVCPANAVSMPDYDMADVTELGENAFAFDIKNWLYTVKTRRSIRDYKPNAVEHEKLENIIQAGRYTATGGNRQACQFVVVQEGFAEFKQILWNGVDDAVAAEAKPTGMLAAFKNFSAMRARGVDFLLRNAPAMLYIFADSAVDAGLAAQNMEMAAVAQGLGVFYNGFVVYATNINQNALNWLGVTEKPAHVCMMLGYPNITYKRTAPRKPANVLWK